VSGGGLFFPHDRPLEQEPAALNLKPRLSREMGMTGWQSEFICPRPDRKLGLHHFEGQAQANDSDCTVAIGELHFEGHTNALSVFVFRIARLDCEGL